MKTAARSLRAWWNAAIRIVEGRAPSWTRSARAPIDGAPKFSAWVAQLVEQRTENPRVGGSNPPPGTTPLETSAHGAHG